MTGYEEKAYEKADDAQYMLAELENRLHGIRYAPGNATEPDVKDLTEIQDLIATAVRLAKQVSDRMNSR